jgi:hypothetical protein
MHFNSQYDFCAVLVACVNFARFVSTPMTYRALSAQALADKTTMLI